MVETLLNILLPTVIADVAAVPSSTVVRDMQVSNTLYPIDVATGRNTLTREKQSLKAKASIDVATGRNTLAREKQLPNALNPINVATGRDTLARDGQSLKASSSIDIADGSDTLARDEHSINALSGKFVRLFICKKMRRLPSFKAVRAVFKLASEAYSLVRVIIQVSENISLGLVGKSVISPV